MKLTMKYILPFLFSLCVLFSSVKLVRGSPAPIALPAETKRQIEGLLRHPGLQTGHVGISIVALGEAANPQVFPGKPYDGRKQPVLFSVNAAKSFLPASNMKLFTAAWVLKQLGPDATFQTRVERYISLQGVTSEGLIVPLSPSQIEEGKKTAPIFLIGGGDPSLASADLDSLASQVAERGLKTVGKIYGDGSLFGAETMGGRYPDGWTLDDTLWYYGPPISALSINRNQFDATWKATTPGAEALLSTNIEPPMDVASFVHTVAPGSLSADWDFKVDNFMFEPRPQLSVSGTLEPGQTRTEGLAVLNPEWWAASLFRASLSKVKILTGSEDKAPIISLGARKNPEILALHESPPLRILLQKFLKSSDNLSGEMLLRSSAIRLPNSDNQKDSGVVFNGNIASSGLARIGHRALVGWLSEARVPLTGLRFSDGSGLSRYNLLTPASITSLLSLVQDFSGGKDFYQALPVAGVDGTLKSRMVNSAAAGNVHAKTGTFAIANCLSGYVTTRDGQRLAVSILTNYVPDGELARRWEGRVFATLAAASWKGQDRSH